MATRIRDPVEIEELKEFGIFFIEVDFEKQNEKPVYAESCGAAKEEDYYEERKNIDEEFRESWAFVEKGRS